MTQTTQRSWQDTVYERLRHHGIDLFAYVPDGGHATTINRAIADPEAKAVPLSNEAEGVALVAGYHLGGGNGVLLQQASGVGNCINQFSLIPIGRFPFLTLITMRGEFGEQNEWQFPMGRAVEGCLAAIGFVGLKINDTDDIEPVIDAAFKSATRAKQGVGVMISQRLIGTKAF